MDMRLVVGSSIIEQHSNDDSLKTTKFQHSYLLRRYAE